ncbi:LLM class flavin-dependent oxidoreductase [Rothia uropygioeca]|uniref:LLM class flavin-dependent oxidoreductase n=1 Tax=Kocuria sp. 257 TaxID=2021970 RepID=UPI0010117F4C|nr:LLM class flavin-dependent oxidoreductase [Kocuria sp. 257]
MNLPLAVAVSPQATADLHALARLVARADSTAGTVPPVRWLVVRDDFVSGLDALTLSAWLAPQSTRLQLVPEVPVTHNEPFHISTATATLDFAAEGRAGYSPTVQTENAPAAAAGRRAAADSEQTWREVRDVDDVVTRLWTSWEPDAVIRDESTGRFIDREKVHYVDFTGTDSVGQQFTVKGPSITPRPPRGELPALVRVSDEPSARTAADIADIAVLDADACPTAEAGRRLLDLLIEGSADPTILMSVAVTEQGRTARGGTSEAELSALVDEANEFLGHAGGVEESAGSPRELTGIEGVLLDSPTAHAAIAALAGGERDS